MLSASSCAEKETGIPETTIVVVWMFQTVVSLKIESISEGEGAGASS